MNIKEFLGRVHEIDREVSALLDEAATIKTWTEKSEAIGARGALAELESRAKQIRQQIASYFSQRQQVQSVINTVNDADCRLLLAKRYLSGKRWEQIAAEMNFSETHIFRLHNKALRLLNGQIGKISA